MARYPFPWDLFTGLARDLVSGRRSLVSDCLEMRARISPPPIVCGTENIPVLGPVAVAANHYQRRGLWIAWPGAVITAAVADRRGAQPSLRWLVTGGLRWMQWKDAGAEVPLTRVLFQRVAETYGITALPLGNASQRGAAVRSWVRHAEAGAAVGIFPEGLSGRSDRLRSPEPGFDPLCRVLTVRNVPVVPCGICEEQDVLHVRFGSPVQRDEARSGGGVMQAIAALLPADARGSYAGTIAPESR